MPAPNTSTAVATRPAGAVDVVTPPAINLDNWPADRFNRLVPTQTLQLPSDLFTFQMNVVQLDIDRDTYESNDVPKGNRAISRVGLRKLATVAGISVLDQRRTDDGTNPDVCEVTTTVEMLLPTGQRIRAVGMKRVDIRAQRFASDAHRGRYRSFFQEHVASRSENRAIRALLSLQASYPIPELAKPFAVVSIVPNYNHPAVQARMVENMAPAITAGYGPEPVKQLAPGDLQILPPAADDDAVEGQFSESASSGTPGNGDGPASTEPAWLAQTDDPFATAPAPKVIEVLREKAAKSPLAGAITDPQKRQVLAAVGDDVALLRAAVAVAFDVRPEADGKLLITAAQAQAIIGASVDDSFIAMLREATGSAAAA